MNSVELWSIVSSIVSVILGIFAIVLSVWFFISSKRTEQQVTNSMIKIETQTDALQKLSGKMLDRLTKYVTEDRPTAGDQALPQLVTILAQLPQTITTSLSIITTKDKTNEQLVDEIYAAYCALYFYIAQTNWWAQGNLADPDKYDPNNQLHVVAQRITEMSATDFSTMAQILSRCDQARLQRTSLAHLLNETKDFWKNLVLTPSGVYIQRQKFHQQQQAQAGA